VFAKRYFLNGPIVHGTANKLDRRSVRQVTGGITVVFSYLARPEIVNRQLVQSIHKFDDEFI
jgi:hypothetical protein